AAIHRSFRELQTKRQSPRGHHGHETPQHLLLWRWLAPETTAPPHRRSAGQLNRTASPWWPAAVLEFSWRAIRVLALRGFRRHGQSQSQSADVRTTERKSFALANASPISPEGLCRQQKSSASELRLVLICCVAPYAERLQNGEYCAA